MKENIYEMITNAVIEQVETTGFLPWQKPWHCLGVVSHTNGKGYSILNSNLLQWQAEKKQLECNAEWLTFKQVKAEGGNVKKGEKGSIVTFYSLMSYEKKDKDGNTILDEEGNAKMCNVPLLKYYHVFEVCQCEGIKRKYTDILTAEDTLLTDNDNNKKHKRAEEMIKDYFGRESCKLKIVKNSDSAYYSPSKDLVSVPHISQYVARAEYYSTLFHEMIHSTGHESRLNRLNNVASFGGEEYSKEELVAEIGSCVLRSIAGVDCKKAIKNSVSYIQGWSQALREDKKLFAVACAGAEKASRYILNDNER